MVEQSKQPQMVVAEAIHLLQTFRGADLTQTIYEIEKSLKAVVTSKGREIAIAREVGDSVLYHSPPGLASQRHVLGAFVRDALSCK